MLLGVFREVNKIQIGLEINVIQLGQSRIMVWKGDRLDGVAPLLAWQQSEADGWFHFESEISKSSERQCIGLGIESFDLHGCRTSAKPPLVLVQIR